MIGYSDYLFTSTIWVKYWLNVAVVVVGWIQLIVPIVRCLAVVRVAPIVSGIPGLAGDALRHQPTII